METFHCNICLNTAKEPIITKCGHLYWWGWVNAWINQKNDFTVCPTCKSGLDDKSLIPIYSANDENDIHPIDKDNNKKIPSRPKAQRQQPERNNTSNNYRMINGEERKDLIENDFLYNTAHLISFINRKSFSWDRVQENIETNPPPQWPFNNTFALIFWEVLAWLLVIYFLDSNLLMSS